MKKALVIAAAALWLAAAPAHADNNTVWGTVGQHAGTGTYRATFDPSLKLTPRDVFELVRNGKPVGKVMLLVIKNEGFVVAPLQDADPKPGDQLVFVQQADVPQTGPIGPDPSPNAPPVTVSGRQDPNWMQTGYFYNNYYNPGGAAYSYANYNNAYPVGGSDVFAAGGLHYPGTYGARTYGYHAGNAAAAARR